MFNALVASLVNQLHNSGTLRQPIAGFGLSKKGEKKTVTRAITAVIIKRSEESTPANNNNEKKIIPSMHIWSKRQHRQQGNSLSAGYAGNTQRKWNVCGCGLNQLTQAGKI